MFSEFSTKHAGNSSVTFVTFKRFSVLLRKLTTKVITDSLFACVWLGLPFE